MRSICWAGFFLVLSLLPEYNNGALVFKLVTTNLRYLLNYPKVILKQQERIPTGQFQIQSCTKIGYGFTSRDQSLNTTEHLVRRKISQESICRPVKWTRKLGSWYHNCYKSNLLNRYRAPWENQGVKSFSAFKESVWKPICFSYRSKQVVLCDSYTSGSHCWYKFQILQIQPLRESKGTEIYSLEGF